MDSMRTPSAVDDVTSECQPLLTSPLIDNGEFDGGLAVEAEGETVFFSTGPNTLPASRAKLGASAFNFLLSGIAMAAVGALLPDFERYYSINDARAALVFPAGVIGYLIATASTHHIQLRTGRRGIVIVSSGSRLVFALLLSNSPTFPLFLVGFVGFGYGTGLTDTAWNTWASSTSQPNMIQGVLHGSFSIGCVVGPALASATLRKSAWPLLYGALSCMLLVELVIQTWAFRSDTGAVVPPQIADRDQSKARSLLRNPSLWVCGLYYLVYQGIEASFTDWIVLFLIRTRHADANTAASASSIFWAGMAIGRYALGAVTELIGLRIAVLIYIAVACCAQCLLMSLDQIIPTLVILGVCGFFLAPLFPSGIVMLSLRNPPQDRTVIVAAVIAMGQIGGAIVPFGMGLLATHLGTQYLLHVTLSLSVVLLILWIVISRVEEAPAAGDRVD